MKKDDPDRWYYTPVQLAPILRLDSSTWTRTVRENPAAVPWPVIICGCYVKFPKIPVNRYLTDWGLPLPEEIEKKTE